LTTQKKYNSFREFYPYYLTEHSDKRNRLLHFAGTALLLGCLVLSVALGKWWLLLLIPVIGYGFAWVGHYFIEKNKPATFTYPFYSLASDFVMFWHMLTGQVDNKIREAKKNIIQ
jgi:hypothetical protein